MTSVLSAPVDPGVVAQGKSMLAGLLAKPCRPMLQFAEEELRPPRGPFPNKPFRGRRFPACLIWFDLLDRREFRAHIATGPTQSGKTLCCFIIPILYCLFELREHVIVGVPNLNMSNDKWKKDLKPFIENSRYAKYLPDKGEGSKGGKVRVVEFKHGPTITFMSFGGGDKGRAGEPCRNIIITETDDGQKSRSTSTESHPIDQIVARAGSFDLSAFIIMECTVTTTKGETWQRYKAGTESRLVRPCPHPDCGAWVTPEREHFRGWEGAENEIEAGKNALFHCPACKEPWTEQQRFEANQQSRIVHRGQRINADGDVAGPVPPTRTLGFRWSAVDNLFRSSQMLGEMEWTAGRQRDQENAKKNLDQYQYAIPWVPPEDDEDVIDPYEAAKRIGNTHRRVIPADHDLVTMGVDLRKRQLHYAVLSWTCDGVSRVIDYGVVKVLTDRIGSERAILAALRYLRDTRIGDGYLHEDTKQLVKPSQVWVDANYQPDHVYTFIHECNNMPEWQHIFRPAVGRGISKKAEGGGFKERIKRTRDVPIVGNGYYMAWQRNRVPWVQLTFVNADQWKTFVHDRIRTPLEITEELDEHGEIVEVDQAIASAAMDFFEPETDKGHEEFCRHLTAERPVKEFVPDKGEVTFWKTESRVNHWFDCIYNSAAAAHFEGVRVGGDIDSDSVGAEEEDDIDDGQIFTPDGRPFYD